MNFIVNKYQGNVKLLLIACDEDEQSFLESNIGEIVELSQPVSYNEALDWAADWIIGAQLSGHGVEVQRYANTMAMSIRAAKRGLTPRAVDVCQTCQDDDFCVGDYCPQCGTRH